MMPNIHSIVRDHVALSITCVDRLYLNGYVPSLQTPGGLWGFLHEHLGKPIVSPALLRPLHDRFVQGVQQFAERNAVPVVHFERGQRKDDVAAGYRAKFDKPEGVVCIGGAQEKASSFKARKTVNGTLVNFEFSRQPVAVNHYYFYVQDREWGPGFVKIGSYMPYPIKLCLNGHEWAKQQLRRAHIEFESLDNGFCRVRGPNARSNSATSLAPMPCSAFSTAGRGGFPGRSRLTTGWRDTSIASRCGNPR